MKYIIMLLSLASFLISCGNKQHTTQENVSDSTELNILTLSEAQKENLNLKTAQPEQRPMSEIIRLNGKIDVPPQNMVSVSIPMGGYLTSTKLLPGMHISKAENLAILEDQQYIQIQQEYLTAKSKLVFAQQEYERQKDLNASKAGSDKIFQQSTAEFNSLKVQMKALAEKLKLIGINPANLDENNLSRFVKIKSPINGYVSKVNANIGKYLSPTDVLCELVDPSDIHLALSVFEKDLGKLFIGQNLIAYSNQHPDIKYPCKIILIGKDFAADRSVTVHCHFEKYDKNLIPGMFMNADVKTKGMMGNVLPAESIVNFEGKTYVFKALSERQFEMLEVKPGVSEGGFTEVVNIPTDKTYVVKGAYQLLMAIKNKEE